MRSTLGMSNCISCELSLSHLLCHSVKIINFSSRKKNSERVSVPTTSAPCRAICRVPLAGPVWAHTFLILFQLINISDSFHRHFISGHKSGKRCQNRNLFSSSLVISIVVIFLQFLSLYPLCHYIFSHLLKNPRNRQDRN